MALDHTGESAVDLTNCDREPIHIPGSIQPHGFLLALRPEGSAVRVAVASQNAGDFLGRPIGAVVGASIGELFTTPVLSVITKGLGSLGTGGELARYIGSVRLRTPRNAEQQFQLIGHRIGNLHVIEFEETDQTVDQGELNTVISNFVTTLEETRSPQALCEAVTRQVRELTGVDRVMLYQFDEAGHGTVLAENRNERLPSYLGLRFPASDIPRQARALYQLNRVRIIPDVDYDPSPLVSVPEMADAPPLDLSLSTLRSVSPIHREYMRNMGTMSSMSVSIVSDGKLWGLISAHHSQPKRVSYLVRSACDVLSRIMSAQLAATQQGNDLAHAIRLRTVHSQLLTFMASGENYIDGLVRHPDELCAVTGATGVAIVVGDSCVLLGQTPAEAAVMNLSARLMQRLKDEAFVTEEIGREFPGGQDLLPHGCGVLAISLSQVHRMQVIWFRAEVIESVQWAGEPSKPTERIDGVLQIHPRNSFASWKEIVRGKSEPWSQVEIDSARDFRNAVLEIVLRRAEELAEMATELEFTNKELEAFSYSVSHDLRAPFRHISGFAELLLKNESQNLSDKGKRYLNTIAESAQFAGLLVDSLLNFSRITRTKMDTKPVPMKQLAEDVWRDVAKEELNGRAAQFTCDPLPTVMTDINLMRQVLRNLLSNAAKYTRGRETAMVRMTAYTEGDEVVFACDDNGVGFDNQFAHKLFGAFQRLHRMEDFEGTGIGLANVRRIISRMGGRTWAEGREGSGATFYFSLPIKSVA